MNILSAKYFKAAFSEENTCIQAWIDGKEWNIPLGDPEDRYYKEIMRLVDAGELTITAAD
jgi:hypothetical protein